MAYNNNVPQANQKIKNTQQPILDNFAAIDTVFAVNHEPFNSADQGKHKFVTFTQQPAAVVPADVSQFNMYNRLVDGSNQLCIKKGDASIEVPFTRRGGTLSASGGSGFTILPSGVLIRWGTGTRTNAPVVINVNSNVAFPTMNNIASVQLTPTGDFRVWVQTITLPGGTFTVNAAANNSTFMWVAYGSLAS